MTLEEAATVHQDHRGDFAVSGALDDRRRAEEKLGRPYDAVATDVSGGVDSVLYDERYVRRKTLPRRQRSVSACGPHGIEIHRIAGAGLQNGNIVVAPANNQQCEKIAGSNTRAQDRRVAVLVSAHQPA